MQKILPFAAIATLVAAAHAQSCSGPAPAGSLTTLFAGGVYAGSINATHGCNQFFDLATNADLTIAQIDTNLLDDGTGTWNPGTGAIPQLNLVGQTSTAQLWIVPTTWSGQQNNQPAWTQIGTGTITVAAPGAHSPIIWSPPIVLTAGNYGVALTLLPITPGSNNPLQPLYTNPATTPGTPTVYTDQYMTLTAGSVQQDAWVGGAGALRVINEQIYYQPNANAGYTLRFGAGCYNRPQSFYEYSPPSATTLNYDLANSAIQLNYLGPNYLVTPSGTTFTPSGSAALTTLGATYDDDITAPQTLPFTFNYPGGSTTQVIISTNGHVFLGSSAATFGPYNFSQFFTDVPRLACAWYDVDMTGQGSMHFDTTPTTATITWQNVAQWDPNGTLNLGNNSFQIVLHSNGDVEYVYGTLSVAGGSAGALPGTTPLVVGFGRGNSTADPGSMDISAAMPFSSGNGNVPPILDMTPRPKVGTTPNFVTTNIDAGTLFSLIAFSFTSAPGVPLGFLGMPGCSQYVGLPATTSFGGVIAGTHTVPLPIPNVASYNGVNLYAQSAPLTPGLNPAGILTSNGLCIHVGLQ